MILGADDIHRSLGSFDLDSDNEDPSNLISIANSGTFDTFAILLHPRAVG